MTKRGRPKMAKQWLEKLRLKRPDLARVADGEPRRGNESCGEKTSSSSSSSSSEESSDSEDLYDYTPDVVKDQRVGVCDDVLREMACSREESKTGDEHKTDRLGLGVQVQVTQIVQIRKVPGDQKEGEGRGHGQHGRVNGK
jgi:hypothetical protein